MVTNQLDKLRRCPFCGKEQSESNFFSCDGYPQACGCWEMTTTGEEAEQVWNTRPVEDELNARIAQLTAERDEWKADAERLAVFYCDLLGYCRYCGKQEHTPDCPITLHRELEAKYGGEK